MERFIPKHTDYEKSPFTGLDRESWLEAAMYLLQGFFRNIRRPEDPPLCRRTETAVTYPHLNAPEEQQGRERHAEVFEGLTRSLFLAAGVIHNDPAACVDAGGTACSGEDRTSFSPAGGTEPGNPGRQEHAEQVDYSWNGSGRNRICLRDYYAEWILKVVTPEDPWYVGSYESMQAMCDTTDPFRTFQQTVETCALVIGLQICEHEIWEQYSRQEQGRVAAFLADWADNSTVPQNWRLFNMLDMAFLYRHGYAIREEIMYEHAAAILNYYVGDGWYRDGQSFDFYSCWAFSVYAPLWCRWYGYEKAPALAAAFEEHSQALMRTYPDFFDRDGWTLLWGRSSIYRNAATSAFDGNFFLRQPSMDPGRARRIASGSLLQFLGRDDFLADGVPAIGFYGPFPALVQPYSCAESVYWLGKAFLCLALPSDHPFWTAKENNGAWERMGPEEVRETVLNGPGLCFSNHAASGETILRTGKVVKTTADRSGQWEYEKLCYNTRFPWEADPLYEQPAEEDTHLLAGREKTGMIPKEVDLPEAEGKVSAQEYVLTYPDGKSLYGNVTLWAGMRSGQPKTGDIAGGAVQGTAQHAAFTAAQDGVLYRRKFFDWKPETEAHWTEGINLADFAVPCGILRCDQLRLLKKPVTITLGSYGFPDNGTQVTRYQEEGAEAVVLKGTDHTGSPRQLAMTVWTGAKGGWQALRLVRRTGMNPDSPHSLLLYGVIQLTHHYDAAEPHLLLSQVLTKESAENFTEDELFPIASTETEDPYHTGSCGRIVLRMKDGTRKEICFDGIEGCLEI